MKIYEVVKILEHVAPFGEYVKEIDFDGETNTIIICYQGWNEELLDSIDDLSIQLDDKYQIIPVPILPRD